MKFFKRRFREPSTWAGIAAILSGVGLATGQSGGTLDATADLIGQSTQAAMSGGWEMGVTAGVTGLLAMILGERE
ncbi:hypothetical protein GCM10007972_27730 [Iodidimonas muriae]|uniref:Uncharacterized protein n=1 Tax=Iodidimonas muriae TaxID=261467 RepID=A0ABQ2LGL6_9PROT|nr:hypothetical protein [Iodidimonas muriae]GER08814.1 hypothetical protein JCM17843_31240 [Kordiimonadales bacterium JCM 17843]GGO17548.1 hypothetical protein GCM10007972_27730 [Iodidimonas muriae]